VLTRLLSLLCSVALLNLSACTKEKAPIDTLPEATQTGAGTMGCLVEGQAFKPVSTSFFIKAIQVERYPMDRYRFSFTQLNYGKNRRILFSIRNLRGPGLYRLDQAADPTFPRTTPTYGSYSTTTPEPEGEYLTSPTATGQLLITRYDSVAQIVSGTFEFTAQKIRGEGPQTVQITAGRFDVHYE
jgi:hypothetical protein